MDCKNFFNLDNCLYKNLLKDSPINAILDLEKFILSTKLGNIESKIPNSVIIKNKNLVSIGKNTKTEEGCFIEGPCIIGENCDIRFNAYIRKNVIIGNNCVVGNSVEIKNSIFLNNVKASHLSYIGDSILGNFVNIGAGTTIANLRFDGKTILLKYNGEKTDTKSKKFGAIISDNVQIGCNSVIFPGTIIEKNVNIHPLTKAFGHIKKGREV